MKKKRKSKVQIRFEKKAQDDLELLIASKKLKNVKSVAHKCAFPDYKLKSWERGHNIASLSNLSQELSPCTRGDNRERIEISKQYPIAPAYNKGALQVVSVLDLKNGAGRKYI